MGELRTDNVPMVVAGFGIQDVFVCEQGVQNLHDLRALFLRHGKAMMRPTLFRLGTDISQKRTKAVEHLSLHRM